MKYELKFEISVYDYDNELIDRFKVENETEKENILKWYNKNEEAKYCEVIKIESNYLSKV